PAARDDGPSLERVDREIDLLAAGADDGARGELVAVGRAADHDVPADRQPLEGEPGTGERRLLRRFVVGTAEPAGARERGPLGHARVALAHAVAADFGFGVGHTSTWTRTVDARTGSSTAVVARSMFELSITGTRCFSSRSTR